jgi:tRNA(His) 5'-end guanylyltransferase
MTAHFNNLWMQYLIHDIKVFDLGEYKPAVFDARAFQCPKNDVANVFLWRIRDWERNSLNMFCRGFFSHKQLIGKKASERHEMLHGIGENWADLPLVAKNGTFWHKNKNFKFVKMDGYAGINEFLGI